MSGPKMLHFAEHIFLQMNDILQIFGVNFCDAEDSVILVEAKSVFCLT